MKVLGIETSCDETGVAIVDEKGRVLASVVYLQDFLHSKFGGVVPEIAARRHMQVLVPALAATIEKAGCTLKDVDAVACTTGPGLMGALLTGTSFAKAISISLNLPFIGVDHLEAHLNAIFLEKEVEYPFIGLVVSGGHTSIFWVEGIGEIKLLGKTVDDAAGEALDKAAKAMGLGYPGGPVIDRLARKGNPERYRFPRAMEFSPDLNMSFSGLKTALLNYLKKENPERMEDLCASFQEAVIDTVLTKLQRAVKEKRAQRVVISGGVASNTRLREKLTALGREMEVEIFIPSPALCTDNGAMVAYTGLKYLEKGYCDRIDVDVYPRWKGVGFGEKIRTALFKRP